ERDAHRRAASPVGTCRPRLTSPFLASTGRSVGAAAWRRLWSGVLLRSSPPAGGGPAAGLPPGPQSRGEGGRVTPDEGLARPRRSLSSAKQPRSARSARARWPAAGPAGPPSAALDPITR